MRIILLISAILLAANMAAAQPVVYPLHVGDLWRYTGGGWDTPRNVTITRDSVMPNGLTYSLLSDAQSYWSRWQRQIGDFVFEYDTYLAAEHLWYDFSRPAGSVVSIFFNGFDTTTITLTTRGFQDLFGGTRRYWSFFVDRNPHGYDDEESVVITDSLGLTDMTVSQGFSTIRGAMVGGRLYGTITSMVDVTTSDWAGIHLGQNYPNPFNASTVIACDFPRAAYAKLIVFDILGRELAVLLDQVVPKGTNHITFNRSLPSGVYFYRLIADQYTVTRKFIIQR
jgi:hypothetical protein